MSNKTIREALVYVANHPVPEGDPIDLPVWELVARALYDIANHPDATVRGSLTRASRAQQMILDRKVGRRRAGTHPAQRRRDVLEFRDLTEGAIGK